MDKYLLEKLDKSELVDTIVDLLEVKALLEYDVDLYRDWYKKEQSQSKYTGLYSAKHSKQADKLLHLLVNITDSLNQEDDVVGDDTVIEEIVDSIMEADILKLEDGKFTNKLTKEFTSIGEKQFKIHEEGREEREALRESLKGTYSYQDEKRRERYRKNGL